MEVADCSASVKIDTSLVRFVVGKGGKIKEKIEKDTSTRLFVPLPHEVKRGSCLVVKGSSQDKVNEAVSQIQCVLQEAIDSPSVEYSHFISLPLALHPALVARVTRFHDSVMGMIPGRNSDDSISASSLSSEKGQGNRKEMKDDPDLSSLSLKSGHGIEESILIKPKTLHLTVLMLKLWSKERVATAVEVLQGLHSKLLEALEHRPITVRLKGLECMKGSSAKAHILYARVEDADDENRLLHACKVIKEGFEEAGLVSEKDKRQELKLHLTLMNSSYRKRKRGERSGRRIPFDARAILAKHGAEEWGEYRITQAHLSQRFVYDENGYYHCCASLNFPASPRHCVIT